MNTIEIEDLRKALQMTLSNNNQDINQAEQYFQTVKDSPTFLDSLFFIVVDEKMTNVKLAAASIVSRELKNTMNMTSNPYDLNRIKNDIIEAVTFYMENKALRKKLEDILKTLVESQYPNNWPNLLDLVINKMTAANQTKELYGSLRVIYNVISAFKDCVDEKRKPLHLLLDKILPYLENLALTGIKNNDPNFITILNVMVKTFLSANFSELSPYLTPTSLKLWIMVLKWGWDYNSNEAHQPGLTWDDMYKIDKLTHVQLKINSIETLVRLVQLFNAPNFYNKALFQTFFEILPFLLESCLTYLGNVIKANENQEPYFYSFNCCVSAYRFLFYAIQLHYKVSEFLTKAQIEIIFYDYVIYDLQINLFEHNLFIEDENQYLYSEKIERNEPVMRVKRTAADVLTVICKYEPEFMNNFVTFCQNCIQHSVNPRTSQKINDRFKEGVLYGLENTIEYIPKHFLKNIEWLLDSTLIPALNSESELLKARSASIITRMDEGDITNKTTAFNLCAAVCQAINDKSLYLKMKALNALGNIVTIDICQEMLKKDLMIIINNIFDIMKSFNMEDIVDSLKNVVIGFNEDIKPFAMNLLNNLLTTFWEVIENFEQDGDKYDELGPKSEQINTIESCVVTITQILLADLDQSIYVDSKKWVFDILFQLFCVEDFRQSIEYGLDLFNVYLYKLKSYDTEILNFFMVINYTILGINFNAKDVTVAGFSDIEKRFLGSNLFSIQNNNTSIDKYLGIYGNYVQKAGGQIIELKDGMGFSYLKYYFDVVDKLTALGLGDNTDIELITSIRLLCYWFENHCKQLKEGYPVFLEEVSKYILNYLNLNRNPALNCIVLQKICRMFYLDAELFLNIWKKLNSYEKILYTLFGSLESFEDPSEKEELLLGIIGLYRLKPELFPSIIPMSSLVKEMYNVVMALTEADNKEKTQSSDKRDVQVDKNKMPEESDEEDDDSWNEEEYLDEKDIDYDDPFDQINPVLELKTTLEHIEKTNPTYFITIIGELSGTEKNSLIDCFSYFSNKDK